MSKLNFKLNQIVLFAVVTIALCVSAVFASSQIANATENWNGNQNDAGCTINFCTIDGGVQGEWMPSINVPFGISTPLPACTYTRPGYVFAGWAVKDKASGQVSYVLYKDSQTVRLSQEDTNENNDVDLYAIWDVA